MNLHFFFLDQCILYMVITTMYGEHFQIQLHPKAICIDSDATQSIVCHFCGLYYDKSTHVQRSLELIKTLVLVHKSLLVENYYGVRGSMKLE